jgi:hypothetical protein
LWLCLPELAFKRLDVQVIGVATLKAKKTSTAVRNCEGRKGWVLPTATIPRDAKEVDVCSIGKNGTMHPIDKSCVKPRRIDDEGHPLGETAQRILIIGPDAGGSSSRPGEYAEILPLDLHDYPSYVLRVRFTDGSHGFFPTNSLCLSNNQTAAFHGHTFNASTFM